MKKSIMYLVFTGLLVSCSGEAAETESVETTTEDDLTIDAEAQSIEGAWEIVNHEWVSSDTSGSVVPFKSIIIFTDEFYSVEIAWEDRPSWPELEDGEDVAFEDLKSAYKDLTSNSGTYSIVEDSIFYELIVAKHPNFMNDQGAYSNAFSWDGDDILISDTYKSGTTTTTRYRRL